MNHLQLSDPDIAHGTDAEGLVEHRVQRTSAHARAGAELGQSDGSRYSRFDEPQDPVHCFHAVATTAARRKRRIINATAMLFGHVATAPAMRLWLDKGAPKVAPCATR